MDTAFLATRRLRTAIGAFHRTFLSRPLPGKLALYLHTLDGCASIVEDHMRRFSDLGYEFVGPDDFVSRSGRLIMLTFDDNYRSWYTALPMFERLGARVTFYVNTLPFRDLASDEDVATFLSRLSAPPEPTLTVAELREIAEAGHTIGAHTHSHPNLAAIPFETAKHEIQSSKSILEDLVRKPVRHFAYPFGMRRYFTPELQRYCFDIGFATVATTLPAMQHCEAEPGVIHRSVLRVSESFERNLANLRVDGRIFERLTGRDPVAC